MMTQQYLKSKLDYDRDSGLFTYAYTRNRAKKGELAGSTKNTDGYVKINIDKKIYPAHRLAWLYEYGEFPKGHIDHINHNRTDNRIENLRDVSHQENNKNVSMRNDNTSGVMGVLWHKRDKRWIARINVDTKRINLGSFVEFHEAVNARKNAEVLYGFHENHGKEL